MKNKLGGLLFTLRPNELLVIRDSDYVLENKGPLPVRMRLFKRSQAESILNETNEEKLKNEKTT